MLINENTFYNFLRNLEKEALRIHCKFWHSMDWALLKDGFSNSDMYVHEMRQRAYLCDRVWISRGYGYEG